MACLLFVVLFWRLGVPSFWDPDEAHYAQTTRELLTTGDWWAPYYNQTPFFDKPIFFHHLQAAGMLVAGQTELGARLVPAVGALALVLTTAWLGTVLVSADVGLIAALLLAVSPGVFALARYAILDTIFTAFLFGGVSLVAVAALVERRWLLQYPGYVLIGAAVLIKGPLAIVLCALTMGLAVIFSAEVRRRLLALRWATGLAIVVVISVPWFVYMYRRFGQGFVQGYALDENLSLYATNRFGNKLDPAFYLRILATGLLPWTGLVLGRLVDDVRAAYARWTRGAPIAVDGVEVLLWSWITAIVGFFSLSTFKLDHYVFPAAPALCLLCARAWSELRGSPAAMETRWTRLGHRLIGPLLVVIGIAGAYVLLARLQLPTGAIVVPAAVGAAGILMIGRVQEQNGRPARVPWIAVSALAVALTGVLVFVMPALESQKVVPDVARWIASHAGPDDRIAAYRLNRWNTAFRFYVDRHTSVLETPEEADAFFRGGGTFYGVLLEPAYQELKARGLPLRQVYMREGMWATAGRALWRRAPAPTRFVVVSGP